MGFFKDFKRDFAQAVNELIPDKDELAGEYDDEDMVNTFDENDNMEIAPEDMLENIDDYGDDTTEAGQFSSSYEAEEATSEFGDIYASDEEGEKDDHEESNPGVDDMADVPSAEIISEHDFNDLNSLNDMENPGDESDKGDDQPDMAAEYPMDGSRLEDELKALDNLDEPDMIEGMSDASQIDEGEQASEHYYGNPFEQIGEENAELHEMDLLRDIENAILKDETEPKPEEEIKSEENGEEQYDDVAGAFPEADKFREDVMAEVEMNSHVADTSKKLDDVFEVDTTYITKNTTIRGNLSTEGSVDVLGTVKGNVTCTGKLIVGGTIKGNIEAGEIYANAAKIEGCVEAEGSVKIGVGSVVVGDVLATSAVVAGAVNGDIDVHGPVIVDSTAVIMGNIKSRSVQINNGAVIEGFCSQCYSEIDVKSFFDMESDDDDDENDKSEDEEDKIEDKSEDKAESKSKKKTKKKDSSGKVENAEEITTEKTTAEEALSGETSTDETEETKDE